MFNQSQATGTSQLSNTLAAVFATEHDAREAIKDLHKAGFKKTWLGRILPADRNTGEPVVEETAGSVSRFFSGDVGKRPLSRALIEHGASEDQAAAIEDDVAPGCAILTVYGEDNPTVAQQLLANNKGSVVDSAGTPSAVDVASMNPRTGVDKHDDDHDHDRVRDDRAVQAAAGTPDEYTTGDAEDFYERPWINR